MPPYKIAELLRTKAGVQKVRHQVFGFPRMTDFGRVEFEYKGREYRVSEPFGDSSRYWIGPADIASPSDIAEIEEWFKSYDVFLLVRLLKRFK